MIFSYSPPAEATNWFHKCINDSIVEVHRLVRDGKRFPAWPNIAPAAYHPKLKLKTSLRDRFKSYFSALRKLPQAERDSVLQAFTHQNAIQALLARTTECDAIDKLPAGIRGPVSELFEAAFKQLEPLNIRDDHYEAICKPLQHSVCPFCGYESLDDASEPLDHFLAISLYPFAGVNLRNLPFMGHKCNSKYKLKTDMLWKGAIRRRCFDPFSVTSRTLRLSLMNSIPFAGADGETPLWEIEFLPHSDEVETWFEVFQIKRRYTDHVLNRNFKQWLGEFFQWCVVNHTSVSNRSELLDALDRYAANCDIAGISDRAFIRAAMFRMLHAHCNKGDQKLIKFITDYKI